MERSARTAAPAKRVRTLCAMALGITLALAGAAPVSAGSPNDLFTIRGHPEADAGWTTCPEGPSSLDEVCVDTGIFVGIVITKDNATTTKEACIVVQQFLYTFDADGFFVFISNTLGELCGDGVQFRSKDLTLISGSGTVPLTVCTPNADGTDVVCVPDGTSTVDVAFTGYGPRYHFAGLTDKFQLGDAMCMWVDRSMFRENATVSGTITGLAVEPFGTLSPFSGISDQMSMRLSHGGECSR